MNPIKLSLKSIWQLKIKKRPVVLSHEVNQECNLKCDYCNYWRTQQQENEMTTNQIKKLLDEASDFGITLYNMWAAEPLLRQDISEILEHAHKNQLMTAMVTNGTLLTQKTNQLKHLDYLSVSMDGIKTNIQTRGVEPKKIIQGIKKARKQDIMTSINCVITQKNINELTDLVKLADKLDTLISFEPVYKHKEIDKQTWNQTKINDPKKHSKTIEELIELKKQGYPIINSKTYLKMIKKPYQIKECSHKDMILHITANGKIKKCRGQNQTIGDYNKGLKQQWNQTTKKRKQITKQCNGCPFFGYVESNLIRKLKPEPIINATKYI
ncbi:Radical SAM superfamily enzyme [Methanonatronarchaeum thermophilum]|uniref:Radical SAM superfamily enzyme n=1 Tax=Methanonatronarchaeum thermophilum TaxID=1927129 RepID=A0A1Y3GIY6_9EURY|nr:radical SAM protein [Methanonatronarchaeum thermophilum]OUJ19405.1 Radical SAM superfamily enzyme [Methanonatronarchaeum thermophilum]